MKYRAEIDGLRALAIVPVVFFHAGFAAFSGGFVGVDVFFVISGYLITTIILDEKDQGTFSLLYFYERRMRRILPALFLVLFVSLFFAWFLLLPSEMQDFSQSIVAVATFTSNIHFWNEIDYWNSANELKPMLHTWSLAVEEQYYLLFPLFLMMLWRFRKRWILASFMMVAVFSLLLAQWGAYHKPHATFFLLPTRMWELAIGAAIAFYLLYRKQTMRRLLSSQVVDEVLALCGLAMIVFAVLFFDKHIPFPSFYALIPTLGTGLIILFASSKTWVGRLLGAKVLVGVGLLSYSAYLWHQPLFAFARQQSIEVLTDGFLFLLSLLSFALAYMSWRYVESPFRKKGVVSSRQFLGFAVIGSLFLVVYGLAGHFTGGFPNRTLDNGMKLSILEEKTYANHGLSEACDLTFTLSDDCRTSNEPELVIWGDSYAMHLVNGILASHSDTKMIQMTKSSCGPFLGEAPVILPKYTEEWAKGCIDFNHQVYAWLQKNKTVKYAVLSSPFQKYLSSEYRFLLKDGSYTQGGFDFALQSFRATLKKIEALDITPIIFTPPPSNNEDLGKCLSKVSLIAGDLDRCNFTKDDISQLQQDTYRFLSIIEKDYHVIHLEDMICNDGSCKTHQNDTYFYRDSGHLSIEGVGFLGETYDFYGDIIGVSNP